MTFAELYEQLNQICKTAKGRFRESVKPPFIIYLDESTESIGADHLNITQRHYMMIYLATEYIDSEKERQIEEILREHEYTKTRIFLGSEKIWQTSYEFEMIEGGI